MLPRKWVKWILFITKNFPPQKWGMEQYCSDLYWILWKVGKTYLIANKRWKYFLPIFGIIALIKWVALIPRVDVIYIGDGAISFIWYILWRLFRKEIYITIHGLDITWDNRLYQSIMPWFIKRYDKIVCVSSHTRDVCIEKWVPTDKITVINNGLDFALLPDANYISRKDLFAGYEIRNTEWKTILLSIGRFIERKWIHVFLDTILPNLDPEKYVYIIWWFWEYESIYKKIIAERNLQNVFLIWKVDKQTIANLASTADLFIMPNIQVPGDMEGFWIVLIEAGYYWLPVIASKIEGIKDAVIWWKTWLLIDDNTTEKNLNWISKIEKFDYSLFQKNDIKAEIISTFSLETIGKKYFNLFKN